MKTKKTTINDLAGMVKRGFDEMGGKFNEIGKRFEGLEKNLAVLSENNVRDHEAIMLRLDNACPVR